MEMNRPNITLKVKLHGEEHIHPLNSHQDVLNLVHANWVSGHNVDPTEHDISAPGTDIRVFEFPNSNQIAVECYIKASEENGLYISYGNESITCDSDNEELMKSLSQPYKAPTLSVYPMIFMGCAMYNQDQTIVTEVQTISADGKAYLISEVLESLQYNTPKLYCIKLIVNN